MGLFGLLNYEDYILNTIVKSSYARNGLIVLLVYIITGLVRFHLSIIICFLIGWGNFFDMIFPIIVTVLLSMTSDTLFKYIETHRSLHEAIVDYLINNYSRENFIRWKRIILVGICCYILLAIAVMTIDNYFILVTTIQTAVSFGICDLLEQKMPQTWYNNLIKWRNRPRIIKLKTENQIVDDYIPNTQSDSISPSQKSDITSGNILIPVSRPVKLNVTSPPAPSMPLSPPRKSTPYLDNISAIASNPTQPSKDILSNNGIYYGEKVSPIPVKPPTPPNVCHRIDQNY